MEDTLEQLKAKLDDVRCQLKAVRDQRDETADRILEERAKQPLSQRDLLVALIIFNEVINSSVDRITGTLRAIHEGNREDLKTHSSSFDVLAEWLEPRLICQKLLDVAWLFGLNEADFSGLNCTEQLEQEGYRLSAQLREMKRSGHNGAAGESHA